MSGGSKSNPKYIVRPLNSDTVYWCNLFTDFQKSDVNLLEVTQEDFIDATIFHLYSDDDTGSETWWEAEVVDVDIDSVNLNNPDFFISYTDCITEENSTNSHNYARVVFLLSFI